MEARVPYPYEFKEISDEEKAEVARLFRYPHIESIRVGPKGYLMQKRFRDHAEDFYNLPIRPDDLFVVSYQRSGTTLTQELTWLLMNNLDYTTALNVPISHRYPFLEIFMYYEDFRKEQQKNSYDVETKEKLQKTLEVMSLPVVEKLAAMPSPRFIKTHMPLSLLTPTLVDTAKTVYIARDPRAVAVSSYHHAKLFKVLDFAGEFKEFWHLFRKDRYMITPFFEHLKEAWEKRHHPNMLFLFYEEFAKDLPATIRRVAAFVGKELNDEQMARLCDHMSVENFKKNKSVNYEDLREFGFFLPNETFIRKGKSDDWRNYFDEELSLDAQRWIDDNLKDTDLRFPTV
ncbi:sulfotransferase 1C4-like [Anticarsia gemmatalis]|uniref:sulfotransferase 1C4-like n=1 Tax=Anticarsia gemmatalis TaxID=129554 RepID=UPI003F770CF8